MTWVLRPAKKVALPKKRLTKKQQADNERALAEHKKRCEEIDALAKRLEELGSSILYEDDGEAIVYPNVSLPHDPEAIDEKRLGRQEKAYYEYLKATENSWLKEAPTSVLKELVAAGIGVRWAEVGMISVGFLPPPGPPPLPDWAKK